MRAHGALLLVVISCDPCRARATGLPVEVIESVVRFMRLGIGNGVDRSHHLREEGVAR